METYWIGKYGPFESHERAERFARHFRIGADITTRQIDQSQLTVPVRDGSAVLGQPVFGVPDWIDLRSQNGVALVEGIVTCDPAISLAPNSVDWGLGPGRADIAYGDRDAAQAAARRERAEKRIAAHKRRVDKAPLRARALVAERACEEQWRAFVADQSFSGEEWGKIIRRLRGQANSLRATADAAARGRDPSWNDDYGWDDIGDQREAARECELAAERLEAAYTETD